MTRAMADAVPSWALPGLSPVHRNGHATLLALDGNCVDRLVLPMIVQLFRGTPQRLDILVINSPKAATSLLGGFLMDLECHGIDYRLTSSEGSLKTELLHYVRRVHCLSVILLDCLGHWEGEHTLESLREEGYRVISLVNHGQAKQSRVAILDFDERGRLENNEFSP